MKSKSMVALTALAVSTLAADDAGQVTLVAQEMQNKSNANQGMMKMDNGVMNTSARPNINSNNWYAYADALCWHTSEGGTEWVLNPKQHTSSALDTDEHTRKVDFGWDWGFRVGLGYSMDHDEWDSQMSYTWFRASKEDSVSLQQHTLSTHGYSQYLVPTFSIDGTVSLPETSLYTQGEISWRVHFQMADWDLGRYYNVSKHLSFRPHVGVKGGIIHQQIHQDFALLNVVQHTALKNDYWGVGPSAGVDTKWDLGSAWTHMFNLFCDVSGAVMWGHFNVEQESIDNLQGKNNWTNLSRNLGTTMVRFFMGFGWETNFNADMCHVGLKLGWEAQYWFRQNQLMKVNHLQRVSDDLAFQGGTLDLRFDF